MKVARKVKVVESKKEKWQWPIDISKYNQSPYLTKTEKEEIRFVVNKTTSWYYQTYKILDRLLQPLNDALDIINPGHTSRTSTIRVIFKEIDQRQTTFWDWKEEDWVEIIGYPGDIFNKFYGVSNVQNNLAALIYLLFQFDIHRADGCKIVPFAVAIKVFGEKFVQKACEEITKTYLHLGYTKKSQEQKIRTAVSDLLLANHSPYIEDLTDEERVISQTKDTFSEWYKLAKEEGIVQASQGTKKGIIVLKPTGEWTTFEAMLEKGWTLEYLQESTRR
ncbi:hypothetical protein NIES4106_58390 (plasmid) [Fischerella sp. NIES-4106]|nr:hypothetical protein NIES4106_58390 [Fischerella sp. NIES-4106]